MSSSESRLQAARTVRSVCIGCRHGIAGRHSDSMEQIQTCVNPPKMSDTQLERGRRVSLTMRLVTKSKKLI